MSAQSPITNPKSPISYDVHTHIGVDQGFALRGWWPYAATTQDLLQHLDINGIDEAVCFPFCVCSAFDPVAFADEGRVVLLPGRAPYDRENALLVTECQRIDTRKRLHPFAMIDPSRAVDQQVKNLQPLVGRIRGLKLQATIIQSFVADLLDGGQDLMHFAQQHDLPVLIHTSYLKEDPWSQSSDCLRVAEKYPKARFIHAHSYRFELASLKRGAQMPNVWVDCAAHLVHCDLARNDSPSIAPGRERLEADYTKPADVLAAVHDIVGKRYCWGSDNPFMSWCDDGIRFVCSYRDEVEALRAAPAKVREDMSHVGPRAWLYGDKGA